MRHPVWLGACLVAIGVVGCAKSRSTSSGIPPSVHPDLQCPTGSLGTGAPPPAGREVWCSVTQPSGVVVREGPSLQFHDNSQRRSEGAYLGGVRQGPWLFWYATGAPEAQGNYASGVPEGAWIRFHPDGDRASEGAYADGKEHGWWTYWDPIAGTRTEGEWILGQRTGPWIDYDTDGARARERIYRDGRLVSHEER